ncbi:MAG: hypothetical protein IPN17_19290 [Deltaproteobacteria bacterium]|nr:hypothetical protein [Deltaproteobacteria bacterium]
MSRARRGAHRPAARRRAPLPDLWPTPGLLTGLCPRARDELPAARPPTMAEQNPSVSLAPSAGDDPERRG